MMDMAGNATRIRQNAFMPKAVSQPHAKPVAARGSQEMHHHHRKAACDSGPEISRIYSQSSLRSWDKVMIIMIRERLWNRYAGQICCLRRKGGHRAHGPGVYVVM